MNYKKISPELLYIIQKVDPKNASNIQNATGVLSVVHPQADSDVSRVIIFIHCKEDVDFSHLETDVIRINHKAGAIRTAFLPISDIGVLTDDDDIYWVDVSRYLNCSMDVVSNSIKLPVVNSGKNLTGENVIIGIIDSGIDYNHKAFKDIKTEEPRILRVWDQTKTQLTWDQNAGDMVRGVKEGRYGRELIGKDAKIALDTKGHGTHVAGIAGGVDNIYSGVAPNAKFVIVKTDLHDGQIADGIKYIFRVANDLGKPAVINLSLGGHLGPHDGNDSFSKFIDQESGPGKIICVAAGNEGSDQIHARLDIPVKDKIESTDFKITYQSDNPELSPGCIFLNGWYPATTDIEISILSPNGLFTPWQKYSPGKPLIIHKNPDGIIDISMQNGNYINKDKSFLIAIKPNTDNQEVKTGNWSLRVKGASKNTKGALDIWLLDKSDKVDALFLGPYASNQRTIGAPGSADQAITVGSVTSKIQWEDASGNPQIRGYHLGAPSDFSSEGPLRAKNTKPDFCAPGEFVCAPHSEDASERLDNEPYNMINNHFVMMRGTSMATPVISGIVALLLEKNKTLDPAGIKKMLKKVSNIPGKKSGSYHTKWGHGIIDLSQL